MQSSTIPPLDLTRLFALIIGISTYPDMSGLRSLPGVKADVDSMKAFLEDMKAPSDRIHTIQNEEATSFAICQALKDIIKNNTIGRNDPILIYFAGHGARADMMSEGKSFSSVQMLCPYDFSRRNDGVSIKDGTPNDDAVPGKGNAASHNGITDTVLADILNDISHAKGNNITVIMDCCYSGYGTRGTVRLRSKTSPRHVAESRSKVALCDKLKTMFQYSGIFSHILLAGSGIEQPGNEKPDGGAFTKALIDVLKTLRKRNITYRELIENMDDLNDQYPQCVGNNQNRYLFSMQSSFREHDLYKVKLKKSGSSINTSFSSPNNSPGDHQEPVTYHLTVGKAYGITKDSKFNVYATMDTKKLPLGEFTVRDVTNYTTDLVLTTSSTTRNVFPQVAYASRTLVGNDFQITVPKELSYIEEFVQENLGKHRNISVTTVTGVIPKLTLVAKSSNLVDFEINNETCHKYEVTRLCRTVKCHTRRSSTISEVISVISGAADFFTHFDRFPTKSHYFGSDRRDVFLRCYALEEWEVDDVHVMKHKDPAVNLITNDELECPSVPEPLGFEVENRTNDPLYVALLYFDIGDLSIRIFYQPGTAKHGLVDPSVGPISQLTIGYGSSGWRPQCFHPREGRTVDVGFLKLFVSTQWIDFSDLEQASPFDGYPRGRTSHSQPYISPNTPWDSISVPVVQRRAPTISKNNRHTEDDRERKITPSSTHIL